MKKKTLLSFLILLTALSFSACQDNQPNFDGEITHEMTLSDAYVLETISKSRTTLQSPRGVLCRANDIVICDWEKHCLVVVDTEGNYLYTVGQQGNAPLEFLRPTGITQTENAVYVIDSGNNRVQVLSHNSEHQASIDLPIFVPNNERYFMDIAVAFDGSIYLSSCAVAPDTAYLYRYKDSAVETLSKNGGFFGMLTTYDGVVYSINSLELYNNKEASGARSGRSFLKDVAKNKTIAELPYKYSPSDFLFTGEMFYCFSGLYNSVDCLNAFGVYQETLVTLPPTDTGMAYIAQATDNSLWVSNLESGELYHIIGSAP